MGSSRWLMESVNSVWATASSRTRTGHLLQLAVERELDQEATVVTSAPGRTKTQTSAKRLDQGESEWLPESGPRLGCRSVTSNVRFRYRPFHRTRRIRRSGKQSSTSARNGLGARGRPRKQRQWARHRRPAARGLRSGAPVCSPLPARGRDHAPPWARRRTPAPSGTVTLLQRRAGMRIAPSLSRANKL